MTRPRKQDAVAVEETEVVRSTLDDSTVTVLREAAIERGMSVDHLIAALLRAASTRVDELLNSD